VFCHTERLRDHPARLNLVLSDSAASGPNRTFVPTAANVFFEPNLPNAAAVSNYRYVRIADFRTHAWKLGAPH
jgi:hypothetical protein